MTAAEAFKLHNTTLFEGDPKFEEFRLAWCKEWDERRQQMRTPALLTWDFTVACLQLLWVVVQAAVLGAAVITILFFLWVSPAELQKMATLIADGSAPATAMFSKLWRTWAVFSTISFALLGIFGGASSLGETLSEKRLRREMRGWSKFWWMERAGALPRVPSRPPHRAL